MILEAAKSKGALLTRQGHKHCATSDKVYELQQRQVFNLCKQTNKQTSKHASWNQTDCMSSHRGTGARMHASIQQALLISSCRHTPLS